MSRRRSRSRGSRNSTPGPSGLTYVLVGVLVVAVVGAAAVLPATSFSAVQLERNNPVDVVNDRDGVLGLNTASTLEKNQRAQLVEVTNRLGIDNVEVTVSLADQSDGTLHVPGGNGFAGNINGPEVVFHLDEGQSQRVEFDASTFGEVEYTIRTTAPDRRLTATMHRSVFIQVDRITVLIDIKPGEVPNPINPTSRGVIPVAIPHTGSFDPTTQLDVSTVRFGSPSAVDGGGGATPAHLSAVQQALAAGGAVEPCEAGDADHVCDVDGDGDADLVLHFPTQDAGFAGGDTQGRLVGVTTDGVEVVGTDSVSIVGRDAGAPPGDGDDDEEDDDGEGDETDD